MKTITIRDLILSCLTISLVLLLGCAKYVEFPRISSPSEGIDKIPLRAGLYMAKSFKEYTPLMYKIEFHTDVFGKFGEALSGGAESLTKKTFKDVVILDQAEQVASKQVNILITPEIDFIGFNYGASTAIIKIKWTIKDITGKVLYMNTFTGEGDGKGTSFRFPTRLANACTRAIEDHFNKAFDGISKNKWWEGIATH